MATPTAEQMKGLVLRFAPRFKAAGFRKKGSTFNRECAGDVVHVINFQSGRYEPSYTPEAIAEHGYDPALQSLYGKFTINLGVTVRRPDGSPSGEPDKFITESSCRLRARIGALMHPPDDPWWRIDEPHLAVQEIDPLLERVDEIFDRHRTIQQVLATAELPDRSIPPHWADNPYLAMQLSLKLGDRGRAQRNLDRELSGDEGIYPGRLRNIVIYAQGQGLKVPRWTTSERGLKNNLKRYRARS